ncbi:MAG: C40 family peptidase [Gemmatimonadetes bacterium]|nr:C40 family peptidase [Gemmatimonadota bacterium]MBK7784421.1 C40 family peptidase [Gemmatimonadota bacterium]MBK9067534.1 C40 family peptidase [Gemmatimonadota bacterium]
MTTTALIGHAGVTPVYREPNLRAEQVTQFVLGETARVLEAQGDWRRVRLDLDRYEGWVHRGYALETDHEVARGWRDSAAGWSEGAVVRTEDGVIVRLPIRARVGLAHPRVDLPDGRRGTVIAGEITPYDRVIARARAVSPDLWARRAFAGTPYQWGGVTPWGVDCSGLVQTSFLVRGITLPRDAAQQATVGEAVPPGQHRPGDLLFFSERGERVTHVALAGPSDTLVHSTVACGGFVLEPWSPGTRAMLLRAQLVAVRRVE